MKYLTLFDSYKSRLNKSEQLLTQKLQAFDITEIESILQVFMDHSETLYAMMNICIKDPKLKPEHFLVNPKNLELIKSKSSTGKYSERGILLDDNATLFMLTNSGSPRDKKIYPSIDINTAKKYLGARYDAVMRHLVLEHSFCYITIHLECSKQDAIEIKGTIQDKEETTDYRFTCGEFKPIFTKDAVQLQIKVFKKEDLKRFE